MIAALQSTLRGGANWFFFVFLANWLTVCAGIQRFLSAFEPAQPDGGDLQCTAREGGPHGGGMCFNLPTASPQTTVHHTTVSFFLAARDAYHTD